MGAAILVVVLLAWSDELRTWTDATGKFKVEAALVRVEDGSAVLKKTDGKELRVPIDRLSDGDQRFLESLELFAPPAALVESLEKQAASLRTASEAVLLYNKLKSDKTLAAHLHHLESRRKHWEGLAKEKYLRMGDKWVSLEEAKKLEDEEKQLIDEAMRLIDVNSLELAGERLRKASQANPQSIKADFFIGLVLSLGLGQPAEAQKYFQACVQRKQKYQAFLSDSERANLVAALNNVAIVKARQAEYRAALTAWKQALEIGTPTKELIQNLGKMGALATSHPHLKVSPGIAREASELYSKAAVASGASKYEEGTGWLFMKIVDEPSASRVVGVEAGLEIKDRPVTVAASAEADLVFVGGGTGFVIAPDFIMTNHHVVEHADAIKLVTTLAPDKPVTASVVTMTKVPDLALLTSPELPAPPVRVRKALPKLGSEMALVGFPQFMALGSDLKATRGILSGLPNPVTENVLLYDAVSNSGNSGGPVCDRFGNIIAVHALGIQFNTIGSGRFGGGVPSTQLVEFLSAVPKVKYSTEELSTELPWEDVIESIGKSTVQILIYQRASTLKLAKRETKSREAAGWDAYEDGWCMTCHGSGIVDCPSPGCANGKKKSTVVVTLGRTANRTAITKRTVKFDRCNHCSGDGKVTCPHCVYGIERRVRNN